MKLVPQTSLPEPYSPGRDVCRRHVGASYRYKLARASAVPSTVSDCCSRSRPDPHSASPQPSARNRYRLVPATLCPKAPSPIYELDTSLFVRAHTSRLSCNTAVEPSQCYQYSASLFQTVSFVLPAADILISRARSPSKIQLDVSGITSMRGSEAHVCELSTRRPMYHAQCFRVSARAEVRAHIGD